MKKLRLALLVSLPIAQLAAPSSAQCSSELERLSANSGSIGSLYYGSRIDLDDDGDTVVLANYADETNGLYSGTVHVWRFDGAAWIEELQLRPPGNQPDDGFGRDGALDGVGDTLVVGEWNHKSFTPGRAYVYQYDGTAWNEEAQLVPGDSAQRWGFGLACDLDASGTVAAFSGGNGGVYVFRRTGTTWAEERQFGTGGALFEAALSADGRTLTFDDRVERFDGAQWNAAGTLVASDGQAIVAAAIDADGDTIVARQVAQVAGQGPYVFRETGTGWVEQQKLQPTPEILDRFGEQVAMDALGEAVFVSGRLASLKTVVTAYRFDGTSWTPAEQYAHVNQGDDLNRAIAASADASTLAIGSPAMGPGNATTYAFRCTSPRTFCYGSACPCGNEGLPAHGCRSPGSAGGVRLAPATFAPDGAGGGTADLLASGFPPAGMPPAVVLRSSMPDLFGSPLFDGLSCLQGSPLRVRAARAIGGEASFPLAHGAGAGTFHYQALYRSLPSTACPASASANLSNGLTLVWP